LRGGVAEVVERPGAADAAADDGDGGRVAEGLEVAGAVVDEAAEEAALEAFVAVGVVGGEEHVDALGDGAGVGAALDGSDVAEEGLEGVFAEGVEAVPFPPDLTRRAGVGNGRRGGE